MSNIVKYETYSVDDAAKDREELERGMDSVLRKWKAGENVVRFLPALPGKKVFKQVWTHFIHDPTGELVAVFACPRGQAKLPCPICTRADQLKAAGNDADMQRAKRLFAQRKIYANAIFRRNEAEGPVVVTFGKQIQEELAYLREKRGVEFTHPETGCDMIIDRSGSGKNETEYKVFPGDKRALGNMDWINQQHDLEQFAKLLTAEEIEKKLRGDGNRSDSREMQRREPRREERSEPQRRASSDVVDAEFEPAGGSDDFPY